MSATVRCLRPAGQLGFLDRALDTPQEDLLLTASCEPNSKRRHLSFAAGVYPGYTIVLKKAGFVKNRKRTARLYREESLQARKRRRKRLQRVPRVLRPKASRPNEVWSMDFVHDWLMTQRKLKCLTLVDDFTKESVGILAHHSISGDLVAAFLSTLPEKPDRIRSDNGPEFQSNAFRLWMETAGIEHEFITPGKPNENAYVESFNSRFRDECLNEHVFRDLEDARRKIEDWRKTYNEQHPHSSLGMKSPKEFATEWAAVLGP